MRKAQQKVRDAAMMVTCLAMMAGCSQGDRNELGQSAGVGAEAGPGQLELQGPVANLPVGSGAEGERVLVQEYKGMVVRSERDDAGNVTTTVWDGDQRELLFTLEYRVGAGYAYAHPKLEMQGELAGPAGAAAPMLGEMNTKALQLYSFMPRDKETTAYDNVGCDALISDCSKRGGCCDAHDHCYSVNNCTMASWWCVAFVPGCTAANSSSACKQCNSKAVSCLLGPGPGPGTCCGESAAGKKCGDPRECPEGQTMTVGSDGQTCCGSCAPPPDPPDGGTGGTGGTGGSGGTGDAPCVVCRPPPGEPGPSKSGSVPRPVDPNDKVGPGTPEVSRAEVLPYQINFENQDGATASAQEVVVVDYLDPSLDWATVDFGEIHYGGRTIAIPVGAMDFTVLDAPVVDGCVLFGQGSLAVRATLSMDLQTGRFEARLKVIDPATNEWPEDPYAGILPPGLGSCSQGHVTFTAMVKSTAEAGTLVKNKADIVFDNNAPITTNEVSNTLLD